MSAPRLDPSPADLFTQALWAQEGIITDQQVPERRVDALGRPRTACCGALDLGPSDAGGRPFQCVCEHRAFREGGVDG